MKYSENIVKAYFRECGLPTPDFEYRFAPPRRWRFDVSWPLLGLALECEGGVWTGGRHTRGTGFVKDMEKYNEAARLGWTVIRCQPKNLCTMDTVRLIEDCLAVKGIDVVAECGSDQHGPPLAKGKTGPASRRGSDQSLKGAA